jgi:hypothetical protein
MKKLLLVLLAFLAVFTYIRALPNTETAENQQARTVEIIR